MPEFLYFRFFNLSGLIHSHWSCGGEKEERERGRREEEEEREKRKHTHTQRGGGGKDSSTTVKLLSIVAAGTCLLLCLVCLGNLPKCGRKVPNQVMAAIRIPVITSHLKGAKCSAELEDGWTYMHASGSQGLA